MHPLPGRLSFLQTRGGRLALLATLAADIFVIPPLLSMGVLPSRVGDVFFAFTMIVAMAAMGGKKGRIFVIAVALAAFVVQFTRFFGHGPGIAIADAALSAVALGTFAGLVIFDVFRRDPVPDRLIDVVLAYLLIGGTFAFAYEVVNITIPGSIDLSGGHAWASDYVYFSFVTMTSVGYGDVLPTHPISRSLAMLEALTGQLYVAVLIARFVNVQMGDPRRG